MNTKVKWFDEDYDLGCDVSKLEKLGFTNSSWKDDIAPSYSNDKMQIFFLNKLEKYYDYLNEWNNCLVFDIDDENHVDINCEFIDENDDAKYERLVNYLEDKKFFIVRWSGDACDHKELFDEKCGCHVSYRVSEPIKYFTDHPYDVETIESLLDLDIGEKFNVDELMQDIEIMRVQ